MMSDDDLSSLADASGDQFDRMWLSMMIEHPEGAVTMAQDVVESHGEPCRHGARDGSGRGQQKEIATMRGLLG